MAYNVSITISLDLERDRNIVAWLERQENRSAAVRKILRAHIQGSATLDDCLRLLRRIDRQIETGVAPPGYRSAEKCQSEGIENTPPKFTAALERLSEQSRSHVVT